MSATPEYTTIDIREQGENQLWTLRIDKYSIAIPWTRHNTETWKMQETEILNRIKSIVGSVRVHEGWSNDPWFKRMRGYHSDSENVFVFRERNAWIDGRLKRFWNPYQAVIRFTCHDYPRGYEVHYRVIRAIEQLLDSYGISHAPGTAREACEVAIDGPTREVWETFRDRVLVGWMDTDKCRTFDEPSESILDGFDGQSDTTYFGHWEDGRRLIRVYSDGPKHRAEFAMFRKYLREQKIRRFDDLVRKATKLIPRHFSQWIVEPDRVERLKTKLREQGRGARFTRVGAKTEREWIESLSTAEYLDDLSRRIGSVMTQSQIKRAVCRRQTFPRIDTTELHLIERPELQISQITDQRKTISGAAKIEIDDCGKLYKDRPVESLNWIPVSSWKSDDSCGKPSTDEGLVYSGGIYGDIKTGGNDHCLSCMFRGQTCTPESGDCWLHRPVKRERRHKKEKRSTVYRQISIFWQDKCDDAPGVPFEERGVGFSAQLQ